VLPSPLAWPRRGPLSTAALPPQLLLIIVPFPFIVWGADEIRRYLLRRHDSRHAAHATAAAPGLPAAGSA